MSLATRRALYGKLSSDTTLNNLLGTPATGYSKSIYFQVAPSAATFAYVVFDKSSGTPAQSFRQGKPAMDDEVWLVKAIDRGSSGDTADNIADRLNVLLTDASLSVSGANHLYLRRMSDVAYSEITDGVRYVHSGALYRLVTEPT